MRPDEKAELVKALSDMIDMVLYLKPERFDDDQHRANWQASVDSAKAAYDRAGGILGLAPAKSRWRCPCCQSENVQISLPTWYTETVNYDLVFEETDSEADVSWWYCPDCSETDSGQPDDHGPDA